MAFAFVQAKIFSRDQGGGNVTSLGGNMDSPITAGNQVVSWFWSALPTALSGVTIAGQAASIVRNASDDQSLSITYNKNAAAGSAVSATFPSADPFARFYVAEYSGGDPTANLEDFDFAVLATYSTTPDAMALGPLTSASVGALMAAIAWNADNNSAASVGTGFTSDGTFVAGSGFDVSRIEHKVLGAANNYSALFTAPNTSDHFELSAVIIKSSVQTITGTGALTSPSSQVSSSGKVHHTGTGALTSPSSQVAGSGVVPHTSTGALTSPSSQIVGSGTVNGAVQHITGTGAPVSPSSQVAGSGKRGVLDVGGPVDLTSPSSQIAGTGIINNTTQHVTGTGALTSPSSQISGTSIRRIFGLGALTNPTNLIAGVAVKRGSGNGALSSPPSSVSGSAVNRVTGTGALTSPPSAVDGVGVKSGHVSGSGALTSPSSIVRGTNIPSIGGIGQNHDTIGIIIGIT